MRIRALRSREAVHYSQLSSVMPQTTEHRSSQRASAQSSRRQISRLENVRMGINEMFTGRSRVGRARSIRHSPGTALESSDLQSPKSPRFVLGLNNLSSTTLAIPYLNRSAPPSPVSATPISAHSLPAPISSRPITPNSFRQQVQRQQNISTVPSHIRHNSERRFRGVDPAELRLIELAEDGRRRRRRGSKSNRTRSCSPQTKNKKVRRKILTCIISGLVCVRLHRYNSN